MRYQTRVDTWIVVLLTGAVALPIAIAAVSYVRMGTTPAVWLPLLIAALIIVIILIVAVPTHYEVTMDRLLVRSGLLRWEVPLAEIESVTPTSNPLSSPAWSLERLEVKWKGAGSPQSLMISPQRTDEFLREVANRERTLVMAGGRLQRSE
ncbi:MAG: PH domain-containing protein [Pyrinomonadaceae bacterium]